MSGDEWVRRTLEDLRTGVAEVSSDMASLKTSGCLMAERMSKLIEDREKDIKARNETLKRHEAKIDSLEKFRVQALLIAAVLGAVLSILAPWALGQFNK